MTVGGAAQFGFTRCLKAPLFFPGEHRGERGLPRTGEQWEKSITMAKMCQDKKPPAVKVKSLS